MPMQAESLEVLEGADMPPAQARAIVRAIEIEIAGAKDVLATKHDLLVQSQEIHRDMTRLETSLREEMTELKVSLREEMRDLKVSLREEMTSLATSLREEITSLAASLRTEITNGDASVRGELADLRTSMAEWRGELRAEIQAAASSGVRQMYMALLGQMAVLLGFAYFFATHVR
jgi:hypothetical protein